jgi:glycosyltransferase involved in cell wall biosynthesis
VKIAQVINADSWGDVTPEALDRGIGGREGALIQLAKQWAKLGHEVTNFVPTKKASRFEEDELDPIYPYGFHEYIPLKLARHMLGSFPYDAVVAWECPSIYGDEDVLEKQKVRLTHMQVAHFNQGEQEAAEKYSTGVVALSEWAKDFLVHDGLEHPNLYVRPNGVDISKYPLMRVEKMAWLEYEKSPSFVYSSSPDRGLWQLLQMWPIIRKQHPGAKLYVGYGVEKYINDVRWAHNRLGQMSVDIEDGMKLPGVVDLGKIGQNQLAQLQMKATAWLYPADTIQATETGCITAIENMAAGNPCIMSDADCLKDEFGRVAIIEPLPFDPYDYTGDLGDVLTQPLLYAKLAEAGRRFAESRDWSKIAPTWIDLFKEQQNG